MGARRDSVMLLAPSAPPCFESRMQWLEYLTSAAESQKNGEANSAQVLVMVNGVERFNHGYAYCRDCSARHHLAMAKVGKCKPDHLIRMVVKDAEAVE